MSHLSPKPAAADQPFAPTTAAAYVAALPVTPEGIAARLAVQLFDQAYFNHGTEVWMRLPEDSPYWVEDRGSYFMRKRVDAVLRQIAVLEAGVLEAMDRTVEGQKLAKEHGEAGEALRGTRVHALVLELAADLLDREPDLDF